jgi:hypothetical protein
MDIQTPSQAQVNEGGVKYKASWMSVMMSSWIPPSIRYIVRHISKLPMTLLGGRAI